MSRFTKIVAWAFGSLVVVIFAYVVIGSWRIAQMLDRTLAVGAGLAQGSGFPPPSGPADIGYVGDPAAAYGYAYENVNLQGDLGHLPAWYIPAAADRASGKPWAVFVHGIGGRRENGYRFLKTLNEAGFPVLMISYRNDSDAQADPDGIYAFGLTEWHDLETAVRYATGAGSSSVILVAESMGGAIAGQFLRQSDDADRVSAIILDAPAVDFDAIMTDQVERIGLPLASLLARSGLWLSGMQLPVHLSEATTTDVLAAFPGPLFLSHGNADTVVPVATSDRLVTKRSAVTEYLRTHADHIQSWKVDPKRYDAALRAFLLSNGFPQ